MVSALLIGFLGLSGANLVQAQGYDWYWGQNAQSLATLQSQAGSPGEMHRGMVQQIPYAQGTPYFHDNFSPYDYNYYHERRHRVNFLRDEYDRQRQLQWEGLEKQSAQWAFEYKKWQQGYLPDNPSNPYGVVDPKDPMTVTYNAPTAYPEDLNDPTKHGLKVEYPGYPQGFAEYAGYPQGWESQMR